MGHIMNPDDAAIHRAIRPDQPDPLPGRGSPGLPFPGRGFQLDHQEAEEDSQEVKVCLGKDFPMQDLEEEGMQEEDQTSWWEIHLKCSQEYGQKLSTSLLNGSFTSALTSPIQP